VIGAPGQHLEIEPAPEHVLDRTHDFDRFRRRFDADAVTRDNSYTQWISLNDPPSVPIGVRAARTMTTSGMDMNS
jgi:hypothetical protein